MITAALPREVHAALDVGCGLGMYTSHLAATCGLAFGVELEWARVATAHGRGLRVAGAVAEHLPFGDGTLDAVLLHEVLEHVADDRAAAREVTRVLAPGGRAVLFVPNRWWPFETHGVYWQGRYRFGNAALVNYLPDPLRNRLAPHVRVYTGHRLRAVFADLPVRIVQHTRVFPGYDNLAARHRRLGGSLRRFSYAAEATPARVFGLSHFLVLERLPGPLGPIDPSAHSR
jgi:SAM-dependent methyltransferase